MSSDLTLDELREQIGYGLRHPRYGKEVEGPRLVTGHEWEDNGALLNDWREVCRTVIEYGFTEKRCSLPTGHDGPHVWGPESPKAWSDAR